jgi:hypothetical protein
LCAQAASYGPAGRDDAKSGLSPSSSGTGKLLSAAVCGYPVLPFTK